MGGLHATRVMLELPGKNPKSQKPGLKGKGGAKKGLSGGAGGWGRFVPWVLPGSGQSRGRYTGIDDETKADRSTKGPQGTWAGQGDPNSPFRASFISVHSFWLNRGGIRDVSTSFLLFWLSELGTVANISSSPATRASAPQYRRAMLSRRLPRPGADGV